LFVQEGEIQARYLPLLFYGLLIGLSYGYAMWLRHSGVIDTGSVVAFMTLITLFQFPTFISLFMFALVQFGLAREPYPQNHQYRNRNGREPGWRSSHQVRGEITFDNVSFGYGDSNIVTDISFVARSR
jgi:ATP-binding cassette subfamily B protein